MPSIAFTEPDMTCNDSSDDSIRRLTDDYGRHRLTDVLEADESEEDTLDYYKSAVRKRYTSIGSTASSMDGLWELHPRRLSEAGLSRHSDSSAVLTEDTDSFIIGQRVWVGGTKPGTIAYIGETQFAPGDWAGIALDEPIGKNDGSVGGTRYFQCENKKGVFSRLTRLTRVPLEQPGMGSNETFTSPSNGVRRSPISPTGSTKSLLKSTVSLSASNTSLNSSATHVDFKIGDRVIIKSTQGSKVGTVRYMGLTEFAPGEWVGVELDDPRGKNDGSVEGKRYFECRPNFGLFAPVSKVSKSPSKHRPSACVVHSGLPPSGMKRTNSKESMTSLASKTSAASSVRRVRLGVTSLTPKKVTPKTSTPIPTRTALQDVLREKQQHIEQLLRERDLERAEISKASTQADEAELRFNQLKQDFEKYRAECEYRVHEKSELLAKLKINQEELLSQLEDEKRKNEDLQFRFEEAAITKNDIEADVHAQNVINENYVRKIGQLEKNLDEERQKSETLESTSNKLFEAEESLIKAREEIETLREELAKLKQKRSTTEEERAYSTQLVNSLQKQIEDASAETAEKTETIRRLHDDISKVTSEHDVVKREIEEIKKRSTDSCQEKDEEIKKLRAEIEHQRHIIQKYERTHDELSRENERLKMEISAKSHDVETATEKISSKESEIQKMSSELEAAKKGLSEKSDDLERYKANSAKVEEDLRKELQTTREDLKQKITEVENVKKECNVLSAQKDQQLQEANKTIAQSAEEFKKLTDELSEVKASFEENKKDIHSRHARQVATQDSQLMALSAELQQKNEEITKCSIVISKLEEDLCTKNGVIEKLRLELESFESQQSSNTEASTSLTNKVNELSLANGDLRRQLTSANERIQELTDLRQRLELEIQSLSAKCENAAQLEEIRSNLQAKDNLLSAVKVEYEEKLQNSERLKQELELQNQATIASFEQLRNELESKLQVSVRLEDTLRQRCDSAIAELAQTRDEYRMKIDELQHLLQEKDLALMNVNNKASESSRYFQDQLKSVTEELNRNIQNCQQKIFALTDETMQLKEELGRRSEELIVAKADASHIAAQSQQLEKELNQRHSEDIRRLEFELNEKNLELQKTLTELQLVRNDCQTAGVDVQEKDRKIGELTGEVQQAQNLIVQLQEQLTLAQTLQQQASRDHSQAQSQCQGLLEQVASLTEQVRNGEEVFKNLLIEHNNAMTLVHRLRVTEQQKQQCLQQLQQELSSSTEKQGCERAIDILNQMRVDNNTESANQILVLQQEIDVIKNQLVERNRQYDVQQGELLRLQQELLKAQEINVRCTEGPQDQNSVSSNDTYTTPHIQHETQPSTPLELQIQLTMVKNSFAQLTINLETVQNHVSYLLFRLQGALNAGDTPAVNDILQQLTLAIKGYQDFKNTIEANNFNLQKIVQYSVLQLQDKERLINDFKIRIRNLQQIVRNLPMQCKSFAVVPENEESGSECSSLVVDNRKVNDILRVKDEQIQVLKIQISTLLNERTQHLDQRVYIQQPCVCSGEDTSPKIVLTPTPPKIVRVLVPVIQPQVVFKEIIVPQVNGRVCPPPRVERVEIPKIVIQKVPFEVPVPSRCILPDLTSLYDCGFVESTVQQLDLPGYSPQEVFNFKQTLMSLIGRQRNCAASSFGASCRQLPLFTVPEQCMPPSSIVDNLVLDNHDGASDAYKQSLYNLLNHVEQCALSVSGSSDVQLQHKIDELNLIIHNLRQNCEQCVVSESGSSEVVQMQHTINELNLVVQNLRQRCEQCPKLPALQVADACLSPLDVVRDLPIDGYSPSDVYIFKQTLLQLLRRFQECSSHNSEDVHVNLPIVPLPSPPDSQRQPCNSRLPLLQPPESCISPLEYVERLVLYGYQSSDVAGFKNSLGQVLAKFQSCQLSEFGGSTSTNWQSGGVWSEDHTPKPRMCSGLPKLPAIQDCLAPPQIINQMNLDAFAKWQSNLFKDALLALLLQQQKCCDTRTVKVVEKPVFVRIPVEVPKIMQQIREVPVKIPVLQPPRIVIKEVPVPQPPKIVIKQVPVPVPQPPQIITREILVPQTKGCEPTIQQVPLKIPVPIKIKVPVEVFVPVQKHCQLPNVNIFDCASPLQAVESLDLSSYNASDAEQFKKDVLSLITIQRGCNYKVLTKVVQVPVPVVQKVPVYIKQKPQVIFREVPSSVQCKCNLPDLSSLRGCATADVVDRLTISRTCSLTDMIAFKETLWDVLNDQKRCQPPTNCQPQIIVRQIPVPVLQPPKVIVKEVPVFVTPQNKTQIIYKEKAVPVPSPPRIIIKQVPVRVPVPVKVPVEVPVIQRQIVKVPKIVVKVVKVPVNVPVPVPVRILQPPRIITKEIPVPVLQPPRVIERQIPIIINKTSEPVIVYKDRPVLVPSPPRNIIREVPVRINVPVKIPVPVPVRVPVRIPVPQLVEVKVPGDCHLPDIRINSCLDVSHQVDALSLNGYDSNEVMMFKQNLYTVLMQQRDCVQCRLPEVTVQGCDAWEEQIERSYIPGYPQWELQKFKRNILSLLVGQRKCLQTSLSPEVKDFIPKCYLPNINVAGCEELENQINSLQIYGFDARDVQQFKERLFNILLQQRQCSVGTQCPVNVVKVPVLQPPKIIVRQVPVPVPQPPKIIYRQQPVIISKCNQKPRIIVKEKPVLVRLPSRTITREVPVPIRVPVEVKVPVRVEVPVAMACHLPKINVFGCETLQNELQDLMLPSFDTSEANTFKQNLLDMFLAQRSCVKLQGCTSGTTYQPPNTVYVRVPLPGPKETVRVEVPVPQPPKILFKQVPVAVPQPPQILVKQVPLIIAKCDHQPQFIDREIAVPVPAPPHTITVQVPVRVPVYGNSQCRLPVIPRNVDGDIQDVIQSLNLFGYSEEDIVQFKENLAYLLLQRKRCMRCKLPDINVAGCEELQNQIDTLTLSGYDSWEAAMFKQKLLSLLVEQRKCAVLPSGEHCSPEVVKVPKIIVKEVPRDVIKEIKVPVYIRVPVEKPVPVKQIVEVPKVVFKEVRVPVKQIVEVPKEVIKEVPVYQRVPYRVPVPVKVEVPKEVIREVRVPVKQIVEVPKEVIKEVVREVRVPVKIFVPQPPKILIKQVPIKVLQPPRVIIKEVPVMTRCDHKPKIIVREKPVLVPSPPQFIVKEIPVPVKVPVKGDCHLPDINVYSCRDVQNEIASIEMSDYDQAEVVTFKQNLLSLLMRQRNCVQCRLPSIGGYGCGELQNEIASISLPNYDSSDVALFKENLFFALLGQRNCVRQPECPTKTVQVPIDRIIYQKVPIRVEVPKEIRVPVYQKIPVKVPVRVPVEVIKEVIKEVRVPVKQIVKVPKEIIREVRVPVEVPRDVVRVVKVPVEVPVPQPPKILTKQVIVPIPQPPKIIVKQVPIVIAKCTQKPRIIVKEKPVIVQLPPRTITKEIPVTIRIPVPVKPDCHLPVFSVNNCEDVRNQIASLDISGYDAEEVQQFKQSLLSLIVRQRDCVQCHLPALNIGGCMQLEEQIASLDSLGYDQWEFESFKKKLLYLLLQQRSCVQCPPWEPSQKKELKPQIVEVPRYIVREVKVPVPVRVPVRIPVPINVPGQCHLPVINVGSCGDIQAEMEALDMRGYDQSEVETFKQNLFVAFMNQRNCVARSQIKLVDCRIPDIRVFTCENLRGGITGLSLPGINSDDVLRFKENLFSMLMHQRTCAAQQVVKVPVPVPVNVPCHLPFINVRACGDLQAELQSLDISGYDRSEVESFKQNLFVAFMNQRNCAVQPQVDCRIPNIRVFTCGNLEESINRLSLPGLTSDEAQTFRQDLLSTLMYQRTCAVQKCPPQQVIREPVDRPVYVRVPVKVPVEVPKIEKVEVPVKVPVPVQVPSPPKILIKQVPVPVLQPPKIIFRQIPVPVKCDHEPKIIVKEKVVRVPSPPRTIIKEVPVKINVPVKVPVEVEVPVQVPVPVRVPVPYRVTVPVHQECRLPYLNLNSCANLERQIELLNVAGYDTADVSRFKQNLLLFLRQLKNCVPPEEGERISPSHVNKAEGSPVFAQCHLPRIDIFGCENLQEQISSLPLFGYSVQEIINFKQNLFSLLLSQKECSKPAECIPKVIRVPVDKPVYVKVPVQVPVPVKYPVPVPVDKIVKEPVEVPVRVLVPQPPKIIIKQVPVVITSKPKILIKQVPVYVTPKTNVVIKQVPVPVPSPPRVIIKEVPVNVTVPVEVPVRVEVPVKVPVHIRVPYAVPVPVKYPVEKTVPVRVPVYIDKVVEVPVNNCKELEPRVIIQKVPHVVEKIKKIIQQVPVLQPPKIIEKPVPVQLPPRVIIRKVEVPVLDGTACPPPRVERIPVPQPPQIITKPVIVPTKVPVILIRQVPVPYAPGTNDFGCACQTPCSVPSLPVTNTCDSPEDYVAKVILGDCSPDTSVVFKNSLLQLLKRQILCQLGVGSRAGAWAGGGAGAGAGLFPVPPGGVFGVSQYHPYCGALRRRLMRRIRYLGSQLCVFRRIARRMRVKISELLQARFIEPTLQPLQQSAVPLPLMHAMRTVTPSMPLAPFQNPPTSISATSVAFVRDLHQVYKNTQQALTHCMDAVLAQTLIQSQIKTKCNNCYQLIQDRELAENQIKFLNSIIVDIQRKNEEQRARIEILEAGCSPAMADELKLLGSSERQITPRMYCDICEEFDLHETEDCPKQNSDVMPANGQRVPKSPTERPYCEICEAFGHATEDCQEDNTF